MNQSEWIVCERADRWATALRVTVARHAKSLRDAPRLFEVRSLGALTARLEIRPNSLGFISVVDSNLPNVLSWLADARNAYPGARFVGLIECGVGRHDVADAVLEAGAADIAISPRHLQHILPLARRHAMTATACHGALASDDSLRTSVWSTLPWQAEERQVR